MIEFSDQLRSR